jgi:hypothetical protein
MFLLTERSVLHLCSQYKVSSFQTASDYCLPVSFYISIIFKSSSASSFHLSRRLPIFLVPSIVAVAICFSIRWFCFLLHDQTILLRDLINFTIPAPCNMSFISWFVLILLCSFVDPCAFSVHLTVFLSNQLVQLVGNKYILYTVLFKGIHITRAE